MLTFPDFNRLRVFYYVYEHRSILAAAKELCVTRSAVSQSLKALEEELRSTLFTRTSKAVTPTRAAEELHATITPFIQNLRSTLSFLELGKKEPTGKLKIGAPLEFGSRQLTGTIAKFREKYPSVNFELTLAIPPKLLELVAGGTLDMAFVDNGDAFQKGYPIKMKTVAQESFVLVSSEKYFRQHLKGKLDYERLTTCEFVDYVSHGPVLKMWFKHHFRKAPADLRIALSIESVHGIIHAVECGMGLGIVPSYMIQDQLQAGSLKTIETGKAEWINKIMLAQPERKAPSLTERAFIEFYLLNA